MHKKKHLIIYRVCGFIILNIYYYLASMANPNRCHSSEMIDYSNNFIEQKKINHSRNSPYTYSNLVKIIKSHILFRSGYFHKIFRYFQISV